MSARVRFGGEQTAHGFRFELTGGRLCLDFANTLDERETDHPRERLTGYQDLLSWATQVGACTRTEVRLLADAAARHPKAASLALARAIEARETVFDLFSAVANRRPVPAAALDRLTRLVARAAAGRHLERREKEFVWTWRRVEARDLDAPLWPVVWSAGELLASSDLNRVRQCAGAGCAWLFLDTSRSGTRRWCDMTVCGNRAKARRFYDKARSRGGDDGRARRPRARGRSPQPT